MRRGLRLFPRVVQGAAALVFAFILYQCWFVPAGPDGNLGTALVWSVWWPLLVLSFFFAGRAWCAICPMMLGRRSRRSGLVDLVAHPGWLKRHDVTIVMAGFFLIVWAEQAAGMRHSPRATGVLLLVILVGAVDHLGAAAAAYRGAATLCPLGGFASVELDDRACSSCDRRRTSAPPSAATTRATRATSTAPGVRCSIT